MPKIVHAADFHLDSAFGGLPTEKARERRRESRELADRLGSRYSVRIKTNLGLEEFEVEDIEKELPAVLRACREENAAIKDIQVDRGSLERHFVRITKGE